MKLKVKQSKNVIFCTNKQYISLNGAIKFHGNEGNNKLKVALFKMHTSPRGLPGSPMWLWVPVPDSCSCSPRTQKFMGGYLGPVRLVDAPDCCPETGRGWEADLATVTFGKVQCGNISLLLVLLSDSCVISEI